MDIYDVAQEIRAAKNGEENKAIEMLLDLTETVSVDKNALAKKVKELYGEDFFKSEIQDAQPENGLKGDFVLREKARVKALQLFENAVRYGVDSEAGRDYLTVATELMSIAQSGGFFGYDVETGTADRDAGKDVYGEKVDCDWLPLEGIRYE